MGQSAGMSSMKPSYILLVEIPPVTLLIYIPMYRVDKSV